ncbi:SRPBCC family protein [Prescottella soli]|uniref:SRPBCC family protein n=1 Tax=Prescottella soli TaxID=1543852 RepID=A0ABW9FQ37_9NOCA
MAKTIKTNESIVINSPVGEVFAYFTDPENVSDWGSSIDEYKMVSGSPEEVGSLASVTTKVAGLRLHATEEVTAYEKNKRVGYESKESRIGYEREIDFDTDGDGATRVTFRLDAEGGTGLFKFGDTIVQKLYSRDVRANLENAKTILESQNG